jgi:hypothetical protein
MTETQQESAALATATFSESQARDVLKLYESYGDLTDHECLEAFEAEYDFPLAAGSLHARRNELIEQRIIDFTGECVDSPKSKKAHNRRYGLVSKISAEQMRANDAERARKRSCAMDFAFKLMDRSHAEACEFLLAWRRGEWEHIGRRWPTCGVTGT